MTTPGNDPQGYDNDLAAIRGHIETLHIRLTAWNLRDDTQPGTRARQAGRAAISAIDATLRDLHAIRTRLSAEIDASDAEALARAEDMLRDQREGE